MSKQYVMVDAGALQMVRNALQRDAEEGKTARAEMLAELDAATRAQPFTVPQAEDFCYCDDSISLQIVSGGGSKEGLYGKVTLKLNGEYVDYVQATLQQAERREMQETEQMLRAEIARLQAVASRAVPSEARLPLLETMQIWDVFQRGNWWAAMVSPIGWDARRVKEDMEKQGHSSELTVAARKVIAADANPVAALMARNAELEAMLTAAPQPQDSTP